jgi:hypothetical protein
VEHRRARRVLSAFRQGSSWPVLIDTGAERLVVKLRATAQGTAPLVAEIVVGALAEALGLQTPARYLVELDPQLPSLDPHEELLDLLRRSQGLNLGFEWLEGFRDLRPPDAARLRAELAAPIVWLDALVQNPDRTPRNPNLMIKSGKVRLIDHGAALTFQYDWPNVQEQTARQPGNFVAEHLLQVSARELEECDARLAPRLTRSVLEQALAEVPDDFLLPLEPGRPDPERQRAAYVAYLWKRLKPPRPFVPGRMPWPFQRSR